MKALRFGVWLLALSLLGGCAWWRPSPLPKLNREELAWLERLDRWHLQGRIGVRGERGSWHGGLRWTYEEGQDRLVITGPLGQGAVVIQVRSDWIEIAQANGQTQVSDRPEELLKEALGVAVPLKALRYWIRGLPAPGRGEVEFSPDGRVLRLRQGKWQVEYREYRVLKAHVLPVKLELIGPGVSVKLLVDLWEVDGGGKRA